MRHAATTTPTQPPAETAREPTPRHNWLILGLTTMLVLALAVSGCGSDQSVAEVESIVDAFYDALETTDPEAASAAFTSDGVFVDKNGTEWIGKSEIVRFVELAGPEITRCRRTGPIEAISDGTFVLPIEVTYLGGDFQWEAEITMDDGLIARADRATNP